MSDTDISMVELPADDAEVAALAALRTGHLAPADAITCGALDGPADEVAAAAAALAGPLPWMADHF